jgi:hypothetical protein
VRTCRSGRSTPCSPPPSCGYTLECTRPVQGNSKYSGT